MKKIVAVIMITIVVMSTVGCTDNKEVRMDYTRPVVMKR